MKEFLKIIRNKKDPKYKDGIFFRPISPDELTEILSVVDEREYKYTQSAVVYYLSNNDCTLEIKIRFKNRVWLVIVKMKGEWFVIKNVHDESKVKILMRCDTFQDVIGYLNQFSLTN
jgi:hypothetical protein